MELPKGRVAAGKNGSKASTVAKELKIWGNSRHTSALDWSHVRPEFVLAALSAITGSDGALMFGAAQGGRGVVLTLFIQGERAKTYIGTIDELESALLECVDTFASPAEDLRAVFGLPQE